MAVGLAAIAAFLVAFRVSRLVARALAATRVVREAVAVIADQTLDDAEKEPLVQRAALRALGHFALITSIAFLVLAAPAIVMWGGELIGVASFDAVYRFLLSWEVIIGASVFISGLAWLARRR